MKKTIELLLLLLMCIISISCDPGTWVITDESLENVVSIELINYDNPEQDHFTSWVPNHFDDLLPYNNDKETLIEKLPDENIDEFLDSFKQTHILHTYYGYNSPKDVCIKLNYSYGNYLIIWADYERGSFAGYIGEYLPDGTVLSFWGSFSGLFYYEDLVNNYFNYNLS